MSEKIIGRWIWWCFGDLNTIKSDPKRNCDVWLFCWGYASLFNSWIRDMELIDLPLIGSCFTWYHSGNGSISRLDRFLLFSEWIIVRSESSQWAINGEFSNHCHLVLRYKM
ncbi:putative endonuclease/exonuclease/phosphatase [Lupinus albus]|uniref:Putative endonuclease/exonuclease/phosphatase n=1 Tax=Lupinus albus TaxID=3870 RepID=A0A6A4NYF9_LUPAL|nr:putative endonuclease/exonuclease/phosphatase [Lupinus albus]